MRVLLRNCDTGLYFQSRDHWTNDAAKALDFKSSARAVQAVTELRLQNMDIILAFDDPAYDIRWPLTL